MLYIIIPIVVLLLIFLFAGYVKAPPNKAAIITGLSKNPRVLLGKSGFKVPFFERVDWLEVGQININVVTEDYIPTKDFINIKVDAIAQVAMEVSNNQVSAVAMRNFLNRKADDVRSMITESLQGNLREIIGTMDLKSICQDKAKFSQEVKQNAEQDMKELGIRILSFNVQNVNDKDGLIDDLGIDNRETIRKTARVAKANLMGPQLLRVYTSDAAVIQCGMEILLYTTVTYFMCGLMDLFPGALRGMGFSAVPMLLSVIGTVGTRIVWIFWVFPKHRSLDVLFISYPASWFLTIVLQVICYCFVRRKLKKAIVTAKI